MILTGMKNPTPKRAIDRTDFVGPRLPRKLRSVSQVAAQIAKRDELSTPFGCVRVKLLGAGGSWGFSAPLRLQAPSECSQRGT